MKRSGFRYIFLLVALIAMLCSHSFSGMATTSGTAVIPGENHTSTEDAGTVEGGHAEEGHSAGHASPVAPILMALIIILMTAKLGGELFERMGQPAVIGELMGGVLIGNLALFTGWTGLEYLRGNEIIAIISEIGVIILLFEVGLESNIHEMLGVGVTAFLVAAIGVIAPFILGYAVSCFFLPAATIYVHMFVGATLCATSVGITARVFQDLGKLQTREAKIILGAAVIDDVMGLVILAVVAGIIQSGGHVNLFDIVRISATAVIFLVVSIWLGHILAPRVGRLLGHFRVRGMKLTMSLCFAFFLAWLANRIELAPIVGAFAAGLILDELHFETMEHEVQSLEHLLQPVSAFLVPVFFVLMGIQVHLDTFANVSVLGIAAGITLAAIIGKQVCGLVTPRDVDTLSVGLGMIPRGEVGLIFANIGRTLIDPVTKQPVVDTSLYTAVVIMVILTTLVTPFALKWSLSRERKVDVPESLSA